MICLFPKLGSDLHERNVGELFGQSRQQLGALARDLCHGKQRVSPFYRVSQLLDEKNVFRFPEKRVLLVEGKQRVSPFYHDLGLDLVGLVGNFLIVEQLLNSILSSSHVSMKSSVVVEVTQKIFSHMTSPVSIRTTFGIHKAGSVS